MAGKKRDPLTKPARAALASGFAIAPGALRRQIEDAQLSSLKVVINDRIIELDAHVQASTDREWLQHVQLHLQMLLPAQDVLGGRLLNAPHRKLSSRASSMDDLFAAIDQMSDGDEQKPLWRKGWKPRLKGDRAALEIVLRIAPLLRERGSKLHDELRQLMNAMGLPMRSRSTVEKALKAWRARHPAVRMSDTD